MRILLVDDVQEYLDSLTRALAHEHEIVQARSSAEARARIDGSFDAAIIDVRLSESDHANREGLLLLAWIKERHPEVGIIMMSAYRDFDVAVDALNAGAAYFLKKPINIGELRQQLDALSKGSAQG